MRKVKLKKREPVKKPATKCGQFRCNYISKTSHIQAGRTYKKIVDVENQGGSCNIEVRPR